METFNFNFKCQYCINYKDRRGVILNQLFDGNITSNILSYTTCTFCHKMHGYEKGYREEYDDTNKLILPNYRRVEHRQIHCILNHFDSGYKKLTNLKEKKNYLKDIVDATNCVPRPLYKKFLNETKNIKMIDEYRMFWLSDYNIYYLYDKWDFEGESCKYRNQYENTISNIMISFFYHYLTRQVGLYRKYFNFDDIYDYLCDIFEEE